MSTMSIDPTLPTPVYFQLKRLLLDEIRAGRYALDGRLPTEHALCERYGLSRTPVTRALSELAREGVVTRTRRRGTFVRPGWTSDDAALPVLRAVVYPGPWASILEEAAAGEVRIELDTVARPSLYDPPSLYD